MTQPTLINCFYPIIIMHLQLVQLDVLESTLDDLYSRDYKIR